MVLSLLSVALMTTSGGLLAERTPDAWLIPAAVPQVLVATF